MRMLLVLLVLTVGARAQQAVIYDDDCSQDVDCVNTLPILHTMAARGEIRLLAMVADSANPLTAPVMSVFAREAGHGAMPIGANQTKEPASATCAKERCNESVWAEKLVARFGAGAPGTRAGYPDCVTVYRRALAGAPAHSVAIVATGFATCLNQLLASGADGVSPLGGAALVREKVKLLSVMGGRYPAGIEWNFECDAAGYHALFAQWTRQHGFPPVYLNGFENGEFVLAGAPATASPQKNPTRYGLELAKTDQRPMWDMLSALFAARGAGLEGRAYFTVSKGGTVEVAAGDGADRWLGAVDSGHLVIRNAASNEELSALLDGFRHGGGFLAAGSARK